MKRREAEELLEKKIAFIDFVTEHTVGLYVDGRLIELPVTFDLDID